MSLLVSLPRHYDLEPRFAPADAGETIERGFTASPGDYDLHVAWAEGGAGNRPPLVRIITQRLTLPGATVTDFRLSDIVVADTVRTLAAPYPVAQQGAHPYALGALEVIPARDRLFRVDDALSVVFQVINPSAAAAGTPDVEVGFRVTRLSGTREDLVGALPAQRYNGTNLPDDFDVVKGHPLFAAVQAPLRAFLRGRYRLAITALDHLSGRRAAGDVTFDVTGTPESLLREAPAPGQTFRRDAVLTPTTLDALARALTPLAPSAGLSAALALVPAARYAELMHIEVGQPAERATGMALRGFALYGLGDSPRAVAAQLQQAATQGAPAAPVHLHRVARRREQLAGGATAPLSVRASAAAIPPAPARPASASRPCATTR